MTGSKDETTEGGGPGWARMKARLGAAGMEALRQDTISRKEAALSEAGGGPKAPTDRRGYKNYPAVRRGRKGEV